MRKCPKCSATYQESLNFCQVCNAMLEAVQEPVQAESSEMKDPAPEPVTHRTPQKDFAFANSRQAHSVKELIRTVKDLSHEAKEIILDCVEREANHHGYYSRGESELTLLNLPRSPVTPHPHQGHCPVCGSPKMIPKLPLRCKDPDRENPSSLVIDNVAGASIFRSNPYGEVRADLCGECGHIELRLNFPGNS